jgi:hypothetical protein
MSDDAEPDDDGQAFNFEQWREQWEEDRRQQVAPGRLPTVEEVQAFQERFALTRVSTSFVREQLCRASVTYWCHENPPTPKAQFEKLRRVHAKASDLVEELWTDTLEEEIRLAKVFQPDALMAELYRLLESTEQELAALRRLTKPGEKQRKQTRKGLEEMIVHLVRSADLFLVTPRAVYTQNPDTGDYSGPFFEYIEAVCHLCGIRLKNQTIGDAVKRLNSKGALPFDDEATIRAGVFIEAVNDKAPFRRPD